MLGEEDVILLGEESEDYTILFRHALKKAHITSRLVVRTTGMEMIEYLRAEARFLNPLPSLIFLDIKMAGKNGLEVLQWVKGEENLNQIPVIIMTNSLAPSDCYQALELGAMFCWEKPVETHHINLLRQRLSSPEPSYANRLF